MAQISIIKKSDITEAGRFDAEYFKLEYLEVENKILQLNTKTIGRVISLLTDYHANGSYQKLSKHVELLDKNDYALMVRTVDFETEVFDENIKSLTKNAYNFLEKTKMFGGEIVINKIGNAGRIYFLPDLNRPVSLGMNQFMLRTNECINNYYLYVFLKTSFGKSLIKRRVTGAVPLSIDKNSVRSISIPIFSNSFQLEIEKIVKQAHQKQAQAKDLYKEAENLLLTELNLLDYQPKHHTHFSTTKAEIEQAGRFDAEYFQPKALQLRKIFEDENSVKINNSITAPLVSGSTPKSGGDGYETNGQIKFIRAVNLSNLEIDYSSVLYIKNEIHNKMLKRSQLQTDDVLFSIAGVIGRCAVVCENIGQANINQALAIIRLDKQIFNPYYVALFFNSKLGNRYVNDISRPVAQTNLNLTELSNIHIPLLSFEIQNKIAQKITLSHQLRKQSKDLLELAKTKVEQEIENPVVN